MILQKMFEICRLGHYGVTDTLQTKCCVAEYGFCIEFVTCVQCALKSHVRVFSTAHMVSALKTEFAQAQCYLM